jgi:hypothetical protein
LAFASLCALPPPSANNAPSLKHMSDMTIQIYNQNGYLVETHSIPDKKEVDNLTDLNVGATQ